MKRFENLGRSLSKEDQKRIRGGTGVCFSDADCPVGVTCSNGTCGGFDDPPGCGNTGDPCTGGVYVNPQTAQYNTCCGPQFCINQRCTHP